MALTEGQQLGGLYRLKAPLGEGGMGCVWSATDERLDRTVAVKVLGGAVREPHAHKRFLREARIAAQLKSPNVAQVFGFGVHDQRPFIVMELLDGEDLDQRLCRGPLGVNDVAAVVDAACAALAEAHGCGVIHRDIKPANLFFAHIGDRQIVKVLDFGIATRRAGSGPLTAEGTIIGTPRYMSPEQSQGQSVDHRSDLWSVAVVAYEALVGEHPFAATTDWESLAAIVKRPIAPPTSLRSELPSTLDAFFQIALRRDPARRFQSAAALALAFAAAVRGEAPAQKAASPETVPNELSERIERQRVDTDVVAVGSGHVPITRRSPLFLVGLAAVAAIGIGLWWGLQDAPTEVIRAHAGLVPSVTFDAEHAESAGRPGPAAVPAPATPVSAKAASEDKSKRSRTPRPRVRSKTAPPASAPPKATPVPAKAKPRKTNEFGI